MAEPMFKREADLMQHVTNLAAADAKHDLNSMRGTEQTKKGIIKSICDILRRKVETPVFFSDIHEEYKKIGTHTEPTGDLLSEEDTLLTTCGLQKSDYSEKGKNGTFEITSEIPYSWETIQCDLQDESFNALEFFDAATSNTSDTNTLYFLIDAVSVPFYNMISHITNNVKDAKQRKCVYINTREGINDSAGKPDLTYLTTESGNIKLEILHDEYKSKIMYPHYTGDATNTRSKFDSIFDVTVDINKKNKDKLINTTTIFTNDHYRHPPVVIIKGQKEHPSSVNQLFPKLAKIFNFFRGKKGSKTPIKEGAENQYFSILQQKRSGDWLQVLSCLDTARFSDKIPSSADIFLVTHDRICLAYALCMGVNVLFTISTPEKVIVKFIVQKDKAAILKTNTAILRKKIIEKEIASIRFTYLGAQHTADIIELYRAYIEKQDTIITTIETAITTHIKYITEKFNDGIASKKSFFDIQNDFTRVIRDILFNLAELAYICILMQTFPEKVGVLQKYIEVLEAFSKETSDITEDNLNLFSTLLNSVDLIKNTLDSFVRGGSGSHGLAGISIEIGKNLMYNGMNRISHRTGASVSKSEKQLKTDIEKLLFFTKLFVPSNADVVLLGIIQHINSIPENIDRLNKLKLVFRTTIFDLLTQLVNWKEGRITSSQQKEIQALIKIFDHLIYNEPAEGEISEDIIAQDDLLTCIQNQDLGLYEKTIKQEVITLIEEDKEDLEASLETLDEGPAVINQRGGSLDELIYQNYFSIYSPALRIFRYKHLYDKGKLVGGGGGGGGARSQSMPERNLEEIWLEGGGNTPKKGKHPLLHPISFLFFYIREILFRFDPQEYDAYILARFAQLIEYFVEGYNPKKNSRDHFFMLQCFLMGSAPAAIHTKGRFVPFFKAMGIPNVDIARFTSDVNAGYFGDYIYKTYETVPYNKLLIKQIAERFQIIPPIQEKKKLNALYRKMFEYYLIIPIFLKGEINKEYERINMLKIPKQNSLKINNSNRYITRTYTKRKNNNRNTNINNTNKKNSKSRRIASKSGNKSRKNNTRIYNNIPQQKLIFDSFE